MENRGPSQDKNEEFQRSLEKVLARLVLPEKTLRQNN
jgi:hypothetical protein